MCRLGVSLCTKTVLFQDSVFICTFPLKVQNYSFKAGPWFCGRWSTGASLQTSCFCGPSTVWRPRLTFEAQAVINTVEWATSLHMAYGKGDRSAVLRDPVVAGGAEFWFLRNCSSSVASFVIVTWSLPLWTPWTTEIGTGHWALFWFPIMSICFVSTCHFDGSLSIPGLHPLSISS